MLDLFLEDWVSFSALSYRNKKTMKNGTHSRCLSNLHEWKKWQFKKSLIVENEKLWKSGMIMKKKGELSSFDEAVLKETRMNAGTLLIKKVQFQPNSMELISNYAKSHLLRWSISLLHVCNKRLPLNLGVNSFVNSFMTFPLNLLKKCYDKCDFCANLWVWQGIRRYLQGNALAISKHYKAVFSK